MTPKSAVEEFLIHTEERPIVIDSRRVSDGDVFVGLEGERVDGNDFVDEALSAGAFLVFANRSSASRRVITVDDTKELLMEAARKGAGSESLVPTGRPQRRR